MKKKIRENLSIISIISLFISIVIYAYNLFGGIHSTWATIIGNIFTIIGIVSLIYDTDNHKRRRGFEFVKHDMRKSIYAKIPIRSSVGSAGYDFYSPSDYDVQPNEIVRIWTDVKAYMQPDEFLMIDVRSSMGGKFMLANTIGIIDSSYYGNPTNDGNIGIFLKNISNETQRIKKNDRIAQGLFMKYLTIDQDDVETERTGGFGSSGR